MKNFPIHFHSTIIRLCVVVSFVLFNKSIVRAGLESAINIGVVSDVRTVHGSVNNSDLYYSFSVSGSVNSCRVILSTVSTSCTIRLYKDWNLNGLIDNGDTLASDYGGYKTLSAWLDPGDYYVHVIGGKTEFDVTVECTPKSESMGLNDNILQTPQPLGTLTDLLTWHDFVGTSDSQDFFHFSISGSVTGCRVILSAASTSCTVKLYRDWNLNGLIDSGDTLVSDFGGYKILSAWLDPGNYYVQVVGGHSEYDITIEGTPKCDSPGLNDNTLQTAKSLGTLTGLLTWHDFVGTSDVQDFYHFKVSGSVTSCRVIFSAVSTSSTIRLYRDWNLNGLIDSGDTLVSDFGGYKTLSAWLDPGDYYVHVFDGHSEYDITIEGSAKPESSGLNDNTLQTAHSLGTLNGLLTWHDFVGTSDSQDFYHFNLFGYGSDCRIILSAASASCWVRVYKETNRNGLVDSGETLASDYGGCKVLTASLDQGDYFVHVYSNHTEFDLTIIGQSDSVIPAGFPYSDYYYLGKLLLSGFNGDPVNTATGNFVHEETDISISTRSQALSFTRFYNSQDDRITSLGKGWTHNWNVYLTLKTEDKIAGVQWGDGKTDYWRQDTQGNYKPDLPGLYDKLSHETNGNWIVVRKNLNTYTFDSGGKLIRVSDKNANTFTLQYSHPTNPNLLSSVADPAGRSLTFTYDGNGLLRSVVDFGSVPRKIQYEYTSNQLIRVKDILGNSIEYGYDQRGYLQNIKDQRGVTTVMNLFDPTGRVICQIDGNDNVSLFYYNWPQKDQTTIVDSSGNSTIHTHISGYKLLQSIQDPLGKTITYHYDDQLNRTAIIDKNGNATQFVYDARGNVVQNIAADLSVTKVEYGNSSFPDLPTKKTDALGNITRWTYDAKGNMLIQTDANTNTHKWTYNTFGQPLTETDENNHITTSVYSPDGLLLEVTDAKGNHTWFGADEYWRQTSTTNARGTAAGDPDYTTTTVYDAADRILKIQGPLNSVSYQYDPVGNRTQSVNARGFATTFEYDANNNLIRVEKPAPEGQIQITDYTYDEQNRKIGQTDPLGNVTTYEYDESGHLISVIDPGLHRTSYTYDPQGNVLTQTDASNIKITYEYDKMNRKIHSYDNLNHHEYCEYDKLGRKIKVTDPTAAMTQYAYDPLGRLISITDAQGKITSYQYDAKGNLKLVVNAARKTILTNSYDEVDRLISQIDGDGHVTEFQYDGIGNLIWQKDANQQIITKQYDKENRLHIVVYPESAPVQYFYDGNGNLTKVIDSTGTSTYEHDSLDRLTGSIDSFGMKVDYGYDLAGNQVSITYPSDTVNPSRTVWYTYDLMNRLDTITDWSGRRLEYGYDVSGRMKQLDYPNGVQQRRSYDTAGRLSNLVYVNSNNQTLISYGYTRDAMGNPVDVQETGTLQPHFSVPLIEKYVYDNDNRLVSTDRPAAYAYDNNGNCTQRTLKGIQTDFRYDFNNRLISQKTGDSQVWHTYDGLGNRIARQDNTTQVRYILDRSKGMSQVLCETNASGQIVAYYIHGLELVGRIAADNSQRYYHTDQIGNVVALTDQTGSVTDRYAYSPFGNPGGSVGSTPNPFTYIGGLGVMKEVDGLYFVRARFYDPDTGRFLGKDPIEQLYIDSQALHAYSYSVNNPVSYIDPSGTNYVWGISGASAFLDSMVEDTWLGKHNQNMRNMLAENQSALWEAGSFDIGQVHVKPGGIGQSIYERPIGTIFTVTSPAISGPWGKAIAGTASWAFDQMYSGNDFSSGDLISKFAVNAASYLVASKLANTISSKLPVPPTHLEYLSTSQTYDYLTTRLLYGMTNEAFKSLVVRSTPVVRDLLYDKLKNANIANSPWMPEIDWQLLSSLIK